MARSDPPGGMPGVAVVIHPGKPDGKSGRMAPPGDGKPGATGAGKKSPEEAGAVREDSHCIDCKNYDAQQGLCEVVDGPWKPQDGCVNFFEAMGDQDQEPDADDQGGPSDQDADDQGGGQ